MNGFFKSAFLVLLFSVSAEIACADDPFETLVADFYGELISQDGQGYQDSRALAENMLSTARQQDDDSKRVRALIRLSFVELYYGRWSNEYQKKLQRCEHLLVGLSNDIAHAEFYMFSGYMLGKWQEDIPRGIQRLKKAILLAGQLREDDVLSRSYSLSATLYGFADDAKRMLEFAERGYVIASELDGDTIKVFTLSTLIAVLQETGQHERAVELAHTLKELRPDSGRARWVLFCAGQDDEFLEMIEKNAAVYLDLTDEEMTAKKAEFAASHNLYLAEAYKQLGRSKEAMKCCQTAIRLFKVSDNRRGAEEAAKFDRMMEITMIDDDLPRLNSLVKKLNDDIGVIGTVGPERCLEIAEAYERLDEYEQSVYWMKKHIDLSIKTTAFECKNIIASAKDYWEGERQTRELFDLANEQKQKSESAYYWLAIVVIAALSLIGISFAWIRGASIQKFKLAKLVDERTKSLIEANKKSNSANEAKSEFLARVNHEIRNPLTAILGYSELLMLTNNEKDSEKQMLTSGLVASSRHLLELVDDVLVVVRIENNEMESNLHEFSLHNTIQDIHQMMSDLAKDKALEFECYIEGGGKHPLFGDETKLRQILLNLLSNAIKFTEQGKVSAVVKVLPTKNKQAPLEIKVSDTGPGIPSELQPVVFEQFSRGNHQIDGTGLGLHICKKLAEHLGGTIQLESTKSGTSFVVKIPFETAIEYKEKIEGDTSGQNRGMPQRILVVDDQESIRETICKQLQASGFESKASSALQETLELVKNWRPQIVLLDLRMPENDGFAIQSAIRIHDLGVLVVAMTGDATDEVRRKCEAHGFDGFLTKPFRMQCVKDLAERLTANA